MNDEMRERLYNLLPAVYRQRDVAEGYPLRALLAVIEDELDALEDDIAELYDNWFIETCDEWVVPYIGDMLGAPNLLSSDGGVTSRRAFIANTLAYRRRKGTVAALEQLALDVTGWHCRAVEFFQWLAVSHPFVHPQRQSAAVADLRNVAALEQFGTPFDTHPHLASLRFPAQPQSPDKTGIGYNITNVGLYLWRLAGLPLFEVPAKSCEDDDYPYRFHFNPLGIQQTLFNHAGHERFMHPLAERHLPVPLSPHALADDLQTLREKAKDRTDKQHALRENTEDRTDSPYFGIQPVFQIRLGDARDPLAPERIWIASLGGDENAWQNVPPLPSSMAAFDAVVDPQRGRLILTKPADTVWVTYYYGFPGEIGGGGYPRLQASQHEQPMPGINVTNQEDLIAALRSWSEGSAISTAVVLGNSKAYSIGTLLVPANRTLHLCAASGRCPVLSAAPPQTDIQIALEAGATLVIEGIWFATPIKVMAAASAKLVLRHCTLHIDADSADTMSLDVEGNIHLELNRCISSQLNMTGSTSELIVIDSVMGGIRVSRAGEASSAAKGPRANIQNSTFLGPCDFAVLEYASNSIFTHAVQVDQQSEGCVRYCYFPPESYGTLPERRYRCQPEYAVKQAGVRQAENLYRTTKAMLEDAKQSRKQLENKWRGTIAYKESQYEKPIADIQLSAVDVATLERIHNAYGNQAALDELSTQIEQFDSEALKRLAIQMEIGRLKQAVDEKTTEVHTLEERLTALGKAIEGPPRLSESEQQALYARVQPRFTTLRYGDPAYTQLAIDCPPEIACGAEDDSEMGVWFYLRQPQRLANLRTCLNEYLRAGYKAALFFATYDGFKEINHER